jgi:hypothetical protein
MRQREGRSLCRSDAACQTINESLAVVAARPVCDRGLSQAARQRVNQLVSKAQLKVNESDLIKEVAVFAERADISEEITAPDQSSGGVRACLQRQRARRPQAGFHRPGNAARGEHHRQQGQRRRDRHAALSKSKGAIDRLKEQSAERRMTPAAKTILPVCCSFSAAHRAWARAPSRASWPRRSSFYAVSASHAHQAAGGSVGKRVRTRQPRRIFPPAGQG